MAQHRPSIERFSQKALRLIGRQLSAIAKLKGQLDHDTASDLCRYFTALQGHAKVAAKDDEEQRRKLSKMSTAELKRLAGLEAGKS